MKSYQHLIGRKFNWGDHDCFGLLRDFYKDVLDIELDDIARPEEFWNHGMDLFMDNYYGQGFRPLDVHPSQWQFGDVVLMAVLSRTANHVAVIVEDGKIFHHLYNGLSVVEPYSSKWRDRTIGIFRHKDTKLIKEQQAIDFMEVLPPNLRKKIDAIREAHGISD